MTSSCRMTSRKSNNLVLIKIKSRYLGHYFKNGFSEDIYFLNLKSRSDTVCFQTSDKYLVDKDNIARSNTVFSHYHGISKNVMQFPKTDIPVDNLAIHPINEEVDYDRSSRPLSYSIVPQVYHRKEHLHPQVLTFPGTVGRSADVFKQDLKEEHRCCETVVETHQAESIIPSWSKYHSNKERNVPSVKGYHSLLPVIDDLLDTFSNQYHCINIIMKTTQYLNLGQVAVGVCDQLVYVLTKGA